MFSFQLQLADIEAVHMQSFFPCLKLDVDMTKYPKIAALRTRFESIPEIAKWMEERPVTDL